MILALIHPLVFIIGGAALLLWAGLMMAAAVMAGRADDEAEAYRQREYDAELAELRASMADYRARRARCEGRRQHERYL